MNKDVVVFFSVLLLVAVLTIALTPLTWILLPFSPLIIGFVYRRRNQVPFPWRKVGYGYIGLTATFLITVVISKGIGLFLFLGEILTAIMLLVAFFSKAYKSGRPSIKRGAKLAESKQLQAHLDRQQRAYLKESKQPEVLPRLSIGGVALPSYLENLGFFFIGSPGSGKSQAIAKLLSEIRQRPDFRAVVFDRNAEFLEKFLIPNDLIFNPSDSRSACWSHRIEGARPETIASALIPDGNGDDRFFADAAKSLLADLYERCDDNAEIWEVISKLSLEQISSFVQGGVSQRYFASEKTGGSVLSTAVNYLRFYRELPTTGEQISFSKWARDGDSRSLFLPLFEEDSELFKPLYSMAFDLILKGLLSNENRQIKTAVIIDELGALNQLRSLPRLMSESRKFLGCPIIGTQAGAQIKKNYGQEDLEILLQGMKTKLVLNCGDPTTAELGASLIGRQERIDITYSGSGLAESSGSQQIRDVFAVMPSELTNLAKLQGYLAIADGSPIGKVSVVPQNYPTVAERLVRRA